MHNFQCEIHEHSDEEFSINLLFSEWPEVVDWEFRRSVEQEDLIILLYSYRRELHTGHFEGQNVFTNSRYLFP